MSRTVRRQIGFVAVFLVVVVLFMMTFRMGVVHGDSMAPTYQDGQVVLVRRLNRFTRPLRRGDVVLLAKDRDVIIKRIFRLPGDLVDNTFPDVLTALQTNGQEAYYEQEIVPPPQGSPEPRYRVQRGYLIVIGDNLSVSEDSRIFGPVPLRDVLGFVPNAPPAPYAASSASSPPVPAAAPRRAP